MLKYKISWKSVQWEPRCFLWTDGQTWRNAFSNFANAPKNTSHLHQSYTDVNNTPLNLRNPLPQQKGYIKMIWEKTVRKSNNLSGRKPWLWKAKYWYNSIGCRAEGWPTPSKYPHPLWRWGSKQDMISSFLRFLDHTQRRITVGRTPLDGWSMRRRDLYPTTHNTNNRETSMPPAGFEPTISAGERP